MATTFGHLGLVFILIALSAPIAKAFRNVCSVFFSPTFKTSTVAPVFSLNQIALISPNSSLGLIINCIPLLSNDLLSSQKLSDLQDEFYCLMDITPIGKELKNSYFFIEDTFYDDMRHENAIRLSDPICEWANNCDGHWKQTGNYIQKNMEDMKFEDLDIRLGSHYLYCHQGDCQHVIIFTA